MMKYTDNEMSVILLNSYMGLTKDSDVKPFSLGEWNKFYNAIFHANLEPCIVYNSDGQDLKNMGYDQHFIERINKLVDRGAAVSFELQEYERKGIHLITEISKDYPVLLKKQLKKKKPPILFYAGNIDLAKKIGIGVVGSRNVSEEGINFTKKLVQKASSEKLIVYSGGARGIDSVAENTSLSTGGAVVSYISDSLTAKIKKHNIAANITNGSMLLFSDQKPTIGFTVGRAMNRNKYIYASAYGTFVIESDFNKGGTWAGATEAIKNGWGKVFVHKNNLIGNKKIIEQGGIPYHISEKILYDTMTEKISNDAIKTVNYEQMDIFSFLKNNKTEPYHSEND